MGVGSGYLSQDSLRKYKPPLRPRSGTPQPGLSALRIPETAAISLFTAPTPTRQVASLPPKIREGGSPRLELGGRGGWQRGRERGDATNYGHQGLSPGNWTPSPEHPNDSPRSASSTRKGHSRSTRDAEQPPPQTQNKKGGEERRRFCSCQSFPRCSPRPVARSRERGRAVCLRDAK